MLQGRVSQRTLRFFHQNAIARNSSLCGHLRLLLAECLSRQLRALDTVRDLLEGNVSCEVWAAMFRLDIDAERRESAVIGCAQLIDWDVFGGF